MITKSFIFLPGVNRTTEKMIWRQGIHDWNSLLETDSMKGVSRERLSFWKSMIRHAKELLDSDDGAHRLTRLLGTRHAWRMYDQSMDNPRFIDIETTEYRTQVTVVGISNGDFYQAFVRGKNLDHYNIRNALKGASCIITFNGSSFDLPIIEKNFPAVIPPVPHFDLRHICAQAGLHGGLKQIEKRLMIHRPDGIRDNTGADAIFLWYRYILGDERALQDLVDYNAADVLNMVPIAQRVIRALWEHEHSDVPLPFIETDIFERNRQVERNQER